MKIATWNVNGVRARIPNILNFVDEYKIDILLLQELKCESVLFPTEIKDYFSYCEVLGQKARNGVAILSKIPLEEAKKEYFISNPDEARYLESSFCYNGNFFKIASIYIPNGGPCKADGICEDITKTDTFYNKMRFCDILKEKFKDSLEKNEITFFCGDYNVCPNLYMDVYSPIKDGTIANTKEERQKFKELLDVGMCDLWRDFNKELKDYTWWGYRPFTMFQRNQGYRIDAVLCSTFTKQFVKKCYTISSIRGQERPSDHIPMIFEI
ncbi:MAG: endonuclease/exonuclease/phosphatase family protein [Rickettsiales bacterium]|jgi:exodeoxyribonuclease-3|nr:endonuclease/exonuclease/phosphatase family protein [Rickettsiales bacterium]